MSALVFKFCFVVAAFVQAPVWMLTERMPCLTRCQLVHVDEGGLSIPRCEVRLQINYDGSYSTFVQAGWFLGWERD